MEYTRDKKKLFLLSTYRATHDKILTAPHIFRLKIVFSFGVLGIFGHFWDLWDLCSVALGTSPLKKHCRTIPHDLLRLWRLQVSENSVRCTACMGGISSSFSTLLLLLFLMVRET